MQDIPESKGTYENDFRARTAWIYVIFFGFTALLQWRHQHTLAVFSLATFIVSMAFAVVFRLQYKPSPSGWMKR